MNFNGICKKCAPDLPKIAVYFRLLKMVLKKVKRCNFDLSIVPLINSHLSRWYVYLRVIFFALIINMSKCRRFVNIS